MSKKTIWATTGRIAFWLSWPLLYWYLRRSQRTRLLLVSGDKVLVTKAWLGNGKWWLPGGGVKKGESSTTGVLRELQEETGLTLSQEQLKLLYKDRFNENGLSFPYVCFVAELSEPLPPRPQKLELLETRWIHRHDLDQNNASSDVLSALAAWFKGEGSLK
ncbi:MAG: hydrolase [Candidatus Saccharibacteria bacterium]|nr:hydrolase [Candidatus Saccharibacteria bacterium]